MSSTCAASIFTWKVQMESSGKFQPAVIPFGCFSMISKHKAANHQMLRNRNLQPPLIAGLRLQDNDRDKSMIVCFSFGPGPSNTPSNPGPGFWKLWFLRILMSMILHFRRSKWGPLLKLKDEVERVIDKAEAMSDIVEKVAEQVEEVVDDIGNHLPEGRLKDALEIIEDVAQDTAGGARLAGDFIDQVEQVEEKVESWMERNSTNNEEAKKTKVDEEANGCWIKWFL